MKVLMYSHVPLWEQHHAQTIEICLKHLEAKDEVLVLSCDTSLLNCPANILKKKELCNKCLKQKKRTQNVIFENKIKHLNLELNNDDHNIVINSIDEFIRFKFEDVPFGEIAIATLITDIFKTSYYDFEDIKKANGIKILNASINLYNKVKKIIKEHNIERVYAWNGRRTFDAPVNYAAKNLNIEFFSYISGGIPEKYQVESSISILDIDLYKKTSEEFYEDHKKNNTLKEFEKEGLKHFNFLRYGEADGKGYGLKQFSQIFDEKNTFSKKNEKKNIAIFPGSNWEYLAFAQGFNKMKGKNFNQYDLLTEILSNSYIKNNFNLYVRWHPFLKESGIKEKRHIYEIKDKYKQVNFFMPESKINSYSLLEFSDIVITFGSTIGVEATLYGKPSILLGRTFWEDNDASYTIDSVTNLLYLLKKNKLEPKPYINALKEGYYQRHRGKEKFSHVMVDKKQRHFVKNKRIENQSIIEKVIEEIKFLVQSNSVIYKLYFKYLRRKNF
tara:strand:+ start:799 stop:2298 length:1500 start_codon:yes stop_codon:yes gene_type:complete